MPAGRPSVFSLEPTVLSSESARIGSIDRVRLGSRRLVPPGGRQQRGGEEKARERGKKLVNSPRPFLVSVTLILFLRCSLSEIVAQRQEKYESVKKEEKYLSVNMCVL